MKGYGEAARIERVLSRGMTVAELVEELRQLDQDAVVAFACDYGDISHTEQLLPVGTADELCYETVEESAYSHSGIAVRALGDEDSDEDLDGEDEPLVVVLRPATS